MSEFASIICFLLDISPRTCYLSSGLLILYYVPAIVYKTSVKALDDTLHLRRYLHFFVFLTGRRRELKWSVLSRVDVELKFWQDY